MTSLKPPEGRLKKTDRRHGLAERGIDKGLLLLVPALVVAVILFVYPFLYGLGLTFQPSEKIRSQWGDNPFANYLAFFKDPFLFDTVWITMRLALPVAVLNVLASIPIAYKLRPQFRGKRTLLTILVLPVTLGAVLASQGLIIFAGPAGWINQFLQGIGLIDDPLTLTMNYTGVFLSLIITGFPFAFLLVSSYLSGIDPNLESAARTLGAGWWQRFSRVVFPLLLPGLATTFILTFVLAFSVFPSARIVGDPLGETRVMSLVLYRAFGDQNDYQLAATLAVMLGVVELIVVGIVLFGRSLAYRGHSGGKG